MAYRKHEQPIVPGSLNLLAPGDKSAPNDCLQLTNWRVDQAGQLVQRWGWNALNPSALSIERLTRVALVDSRRYYFGNGKLYQLGTYDPGGVDGEIDSGYSGGPVSIVSFQGLAWIMNNGKQRVDDGTSTWNWTPETPGTVSLSASTPGGAALAVGDWTYYVTFQTAEGHESNPSAAAVVTVAANGAVAVTRPSRSENRSKHDNTTTPNITHWNVYRTGPGLGSIYRVNTNAIAYATSVYNDYGAATGGTETDQTNEDLQDRNIVLEFDHDAAPAAIGAAGTYDGRILAFRTIANPNRIFWTRPNEPWYFPAANYADVGALNDTILAVSMKPNQIIVYKQKSIWRIVGELGEGRIELVSSDLGIVGMNAIARTSRGDYIAGKEGLYFFNGESGRKVSTQIDPLFKDQDVEIAYGIGYIRANGNIGNCAVGHRNGRVYFSYPTGSGLYPTDEGRTMILDVETGRWADWDQAWNDYLDEGQNGSFVAAGDQIVGSIETGYVDYGPAAYDLMFQSRYQDQGAPNNEKTYADLVIEHNTRGQNMTVKVIKNNGIVAGNEYTLTSITSTARTTSIVRLIDGSGDPIKGFNLAVRLECTTNSGATAPIIVYAIFLHSYTEASQHKSFDTDEMTLGAPGVKEVKEIAIDAQIDGTTNLSLWSDYPNQVVTKRSVFGAADPYAIAATTGRTILRIPVDQYTYGSLIRLTLTAASNQFRLYGLSLLVRKIGVFIEAYETAIRGYWYSDHQDFGVPAVKNARELELDIDTSGNVTYTLTSDLPGNAMATRKTGTVNTEATTTRRRIVRIPLDAGTEGRNFALKLTSADKEVILYGARLEVKPFGVYVEAYENAANLVWDSDVLDLGIQDVKDFAELQFDIDTDGAITYNVFTDLPNQTMASRATSTFNTEATTTGRRMVNIPLSNIQGHLLQIKLSGTVAYRLYGIRARVRPYFFYVEASTAAAGAIYDSTELHWGSPDPKEFDSLVLDIDASGTLTATVYTDLPGDAMASRATYTIPLSTTRRTVTIPLNQIKGRLARVTISGSNAYKLYGGFLRLRPVAVYLNGGNSESYRTRELDFGIEAVKMYGEVEVDLETAGTATLKVYTDQPGGAVTLRDTVTIAGSGAREKKKIRLAGLRKGRLIKLEFTTDSSALTIHGARIWLKPMGGRAPSEWQWAAVLMPSTPETYSEVKLPVKTTPEQWDWVDLPVAKTPTDWTWVPFPVEKTPSEYQLVEVPVGE
jgi:hypothetical protein